MHSNTNLKNNFPIFGSYNDIEIFFKHLNIHLKNTTTIIKVINSSIYILISFFKRSN